MAPRDRREVWHDKPVVIVMKESGTLYFSGTATVEYVPGEERYEEGVADISDTATGKHVLSARIGSQRTFAEFDQSNPYRLRWSRLGITANAVDTGGHEYTIYIGRHAHNYLLRRRGGIEAMGADAEFEPTKEEPVEGP